MAPAAAATPDCKCRYFGQFYNLGERVCIKTPDGLRVARCELMLNNSSWKILNQRCPDLVRRMTPAPSVDRTPAIGVALTLRKAAPTR